MSLLMGNAKDPVQENYCAKCKKDIPDLTSVSSSEIENVHENIDCGDSNIRHLDEGVKRFHFVNHFEYKFNHYGWFRLPAVVLPLYFFILSFGQKKHLHRKVGKLLQNIMEQKEQISGPISIENDQQLMKN